MDIYPGAHAKPWTKYLGEAWQSVKTDKMIGTSLLAALVALIPLVGPLFVSGWSFNYAMRKYPLTPSTRPKFFTSDNILVGLWIWIFCLILGAAGSLLAQIPLFGWIFSIAASLFVVVFTPMIGAMMTKKAEFGKIFEIERYKQIFKAVGGPLSALTLIPSLILSVALGLVAAIIFVPVLLTSGALSYLSLESLAGAGIFTFIISIFFWLLFFSIIFWSFSIITNLVIYRAAVRLLEDYCPQTISADSIDGSSNSVPPSYTQYTQAHQTPSQPTQAQTSPQNKPQSQNEDVIPTHNPDLD